MFLQILLTFAASESFLLHAPSKIPSSFGVHVVRLYTHPSSLQLPTDPLVAFSLIKAVNPRHVFFTLLPHHHFW